MRLLRVAEWRERMPDKTPYFKLFTAANTLVLSPDHIPQTSPSKTVGLAHIRSNATIPMTYYLLIFGTKRGRYDS